MLRRVPITRLFEVPLLVFLLGVTGAAMLVPAGFAALTGEGGLAESFAVTAGLVMVGALLLGVATTRYEPRNPERSQFLSLLGAYAVLPPIMAVPIAAPELGLGFAGAWFEMLSAFTTTGATLLVEPGSVADVVHLWRALAGWLGGLFVLLVAIALLAPLNLGGLEVESGRPVGRAESGVPGGGALMDSSTRMLHYLGLLAPLYAGLTAALWLGLMVTGAQPFVALCHAMSILSSSGISPVGGVQHGESGRLGEALMLVFLVFALTRRSLPGRVQPDQRRALRRDPELRMAVLVIGMLTLALFLRHWLGAFERDGATDLGAALRALWGSVFTLTSFLTTTGFVSADWEGARIWSGLATPGLLLAGLALLGGGVATTAGGIKLLRAVALYRHGRHEVEKLVHPSLVGGGGNRARRLRGEGAYAAWVAFMLYLLSLATVLALLALTGLRFEDALILSIAAITTTGPLAGAVADGALSYAALDTGQHAILGLAMVLGRLELLAIVVLMFPESWRG